MKGADKVGILGGGQLALMLGEAAERMGLGVFVFAASKTDPAFKKFKSGVVGKIEDRDAVSRFCSEVEPIVFESDFLPYGTLREFGGARFLPELKVIERLSDKIEQKAVLQSAGFKVPRFEVFSGAEGDVSNWLERLEKDFPSGFVMKWARGGYDGKGVWISGESAFPAREFLLQAFRRGTSVFAEEKILYKRELAKMGVFSIAGEFRTYDMTISKQTSGICDYVIGPAREYGVSPDQEKTIENCLERLAHQLNLVGCFAVEMFETESGDIVANEIAPRVHNTGHFSLGMPIVSQFENHLRAVLGMRLGETKSSQLFLMKNILGRVDRQDVVPPKNAPSGWRLKWYDKTDLRVGRKMGHLQVDGFSISQTDGLLGLAESCVHNWNLEQQSA